MTCVRFKGFKTPATIDREVAERRALVVQDERDHPQDQVPRDIRGPSVAAPSTEPPTVTLTPARRVQLLRGVHLLRHICLLRVPLPAAIGEGEKVIGKSVVESGAS